ncbi:D-alanyl-lipoteichoic acid biosynthesis protein DltD [Neobacillus sp. SuZ13]|uniref:D-alanyl-lipoteichoic acid biosynthesis protein DltD n=1 Tax=Neobacillus sp. SuZ13 TaxID=3047875 RepID=UPI0024BFC631|nr:D-alanyl-lipoteichoic acid biosynthesis protein DltD [Neobacillus sp. SuZ13]WHY66847.1 D-alanyl-lipoteichoic acid biosynthesis protein DltD [Neobacillus sp. SuZ13]
MVRSSFKPLMVAVILFSILLLFPAQWLLPWINDKLVERESVGLDPNMFQGYLVQQKMLDDPAYLPVYGSSELARLDPFHPSNYFHVNPQGFTPFLVGRGGTEALLHFLNFSAHADQLKGKRIVFVLSPQWFVPEGSDESHFAPNFSVLQGYQFALNPKVNHSLVIEGSKRLLAYNVVKSDWMLSSLLEANLYHDKWHQTKAMVIKPFAYGFLHVLERRDLILSLLDVHLKKLHPKPALTQNKSWAELEDAASHLAAKKAADNPFFVNDFYYKAMLQPKLDKLHGYKKGASYATSKQYQDLQLVLDVLKEAGAKPLFVSVPVNGYWSDYTGFPAKGRTDYYVKVKKQVEKNGFPILDLSSHEYDKYFFKDTIHLGYKGWVSVDKGILQFEKQQ